MAQILSERLPWTLLIMGTTLAGSLLFGILLAFISVKKKRIDGALYSIMSALSEIPDVYKRQPREYIKKHPLYRGAL